MQPIRFAFFVLIIIITLCLVDYTHPSENIQAAPFPKKPNRQLTPGSFCTPDDPDFMEYRYREHVAVCFRNVSTETRQEVFHLYNIPWSKRDAYTVDHYMSLFAGGSNNIDNLWPQHKSISTAKDENELFHEINDGYLTLEEVIAALVNLKNRRS